MKLYIAGGCSEHGRNSFLISGETVSVLVDAGRMKEKPEEPFPRLSRDQIEKIDYLFLTHCHTDHTGAISWLYERGFRGTIAGSAATIRNIPPFKADYIVLEELAGPEEEIRIRDGLSLVWGRAGHCIGSVWYSFCIEGRTILFTGDYEECSYAYECDRIRGRTADLAVIDCAYGTEKEDAQMHWKALEKALDRLAEKHKPLLFPVPSHGRGFDILKLLVDRDVTVVLAESLIKEFCNSPDREFWLKESFLNVTTRLKKKDIHEFERDFRECLAKKDFFPRAYADTAILVRDSQLYKGENRQISIGVSSMGGRTILTGKQDPSSFARGLLNSGDADFYRISVHQNITEMYRLREKNHFTKVIPYHCREQLKFTEPDILVTEPGDEVLF
jgi:glyoxylase-like metal-dependent hydrolase (beta-lactamase superfamily II)